MENYSTSSKKTLLLLLKSRKEMLKQELLVFCTIDDIKTLLKLCKSSKQMIEEFYLSNWNELSGLIAHYWDID
jgi:hypothetical protein